jgi:hypothetical protein
MWTYSPRIVKSTLYGKTGYLSVYSIAFTLFNRVGRETEWPTLQMSSLVNIQCTELKEQSLFSKHDEPRTVDVKIQ